jgi:hypothetical protein
MKLFAVIMSSFLMMLIVPGCLGSESIPGEGEETLPGDIEAPGLKALCVPVPDTKTEHVGSCGVCKTSGGYNGLWHVEYYRECCGGWCTPWEKVSTCGSCAG